MKTNFVISAIYDLRKDRFNLSRDVPLRIQKWNHTYYIVFKKKWPIHIPMSPFLAKFWTKLTNFGFHSWKILKKEEKQQQNKTKQNKTKQNKTKQNKNPLIYQILSFRVGSPEGWFVMFAAYPR